MGLSYYGSWLTPLIWKNDNFVTFLFLTERLTNPFSKCRNFLIVARVLFHKFGAKS